MSFERMEQCFDRIDKRFDRMEERLDQIHENFMEVLKALNRQIYWLVGSIFAASGLILAFMKL